MWLKIYPKEGESPLYLSSTLSEKERERIRKIYGDEEWKNIRDFIHSINLNRSRKLIITKTALRLAKLIKDKFDIEVYPTIISIRRGYWQRAEGTWCWYMKTKEGFDIGSADTVSDILRFQELVGMYSSVFSEFYELFIDTSQSKLKEKGYFICSECGKIYKNEIYYKLHLLKHER